MQRHYIHQRKTSSQDFHTVCLIWTPRSDCFLFVIPIRISAFVIPKKKDLLNQPINFSSLIYLKIVTKYFVYVLFISDSVEQFIQSKVFARGWTHQICLPRLPLNPASISKKVFKGFKQPTRPSAEQEIKNRRGGQIKPCRFLQHYSN